MIDPARRDAIVRLLEHLLDGLPVRSPSSFTSSGFVHDDAEESCPDCLANDRAMFGCETCGGSGRVRLGRRRDPYADRYTRPFGYDPTRHDRGRAVDAEIRRLDEQTAPPKSEADQQAEANRHPPAWVQVRESLWGSFDFAALSRALELLRDVDEDAYRAVHAVHVYGWLPQEGAAAALAERAVVFIDGWMPQPPDTIRAPPRRRVTSPEERSLAARNRRIRERFFDEQVPAKALAEDYALSVSQINRILAGEGSSG